MKIAYLFHCDAANPAVQSGHPASILEGLRRQGADIEPVFPLQTRIRPALPQKLCYRLGGRLHRADRDPEYLSAAAAEFAARTAGKSFDLVFSPGSEMISHLSTPVPLTFCADATFANMVDYYWDFTRLSADYLRKGHAQEAAALARASLAVYPSAWAARSAIRDYGADPAKVAVIPFGANLGRDNPRGQVLEWIERRPREPLRLLFVGRHWQRKGGDLVVGAGYCLAKLGRRVVVDIVGCEVPATHRGLPWLRGHGLLRRDLPGQMARLRELFAAAHFVFVPSRAEAYGITFAEAGAFGVPSVATDTGGVSAVVENGYNGFLLPPDADAAAYADAIAAAFESRDGYERLCLQSHERFRQRLNWDAFCRSFLELAAARAPGLRDWPGLAHNLPASVAAEPSVA